MRKTIIAASAAALLALSACGNEDVQGAVDGAKDAASSQADKATEAAGSAAADATDAAGKAMNGEGSGAEGAEGEGANAEGADGANGEGGSAEGEGADGAAAGGGEMAPIALPDGSEVQVPAGIAQKYEEIQGASGHLGAPVGEAQEVAGGQMLEFEGGTIIQNPDGQAFLVQGEILKEYTANGGPGGDLGFPTTDETPQDGGFISTFDNGEITWDIAGEQATVTPN